MKRPTRSSALGLAAELVLIFLGITAALWFESMQNQREQNRLEVEILKEMAVDLTADTADLNSTLANVRLFIAASDTVLDRLAGRAPYDPDMDRLFGYAAALNVLFHHPAAYEHLKSAGLDVISNSPLRAQIIEYYSSHIPQILLVEDLLVRGPWEAELLPQMIRKFEYRGFQGPATPLDYGALQTDSEFQSTLRATAAGHRAQIAVTGVALSAAEDLLRDIDVELGGR